MMTFDLRFTEPMSTIDSTERRIGGKRMRRYLRLSFMCILLYGLSACVTSQTEQPNFNTEILEFQSESRGEVKPVIALVAAPLEATHPLPVIITQHGSSRDGMSFPGGGGQTDEYSTRLIKEGTKRGFAVVAIDAFYETSIKPNDKRKFPNAFQYAFDLREILANDPRFDKKNIFFTGFSYGASQVNKSISGNVNYGQHPWRAVAAAEPGCNIISEPIKVSFSLLMIKGAESHYYVEPCQFYIKLLRNAGNDASLTIIEGANHFFSTDGRITEGIAVNGCRYNPVIRKLDGSTAFADGTPANSELIREKCITKEAGSGKNRVYLDAVIDQVLNFFEKHKV